MLYFLPPVFVFIVIYIYIECLNSISFPGLNKIGSLNIENEDAADNVLLEHQRVGEGSDNDSDSFDEEDDDIIPNEMKMPQSSSELNQNVHAEWEFPSIFEDAKDLGASKAPSGSGSKSFSSHNRFLAIGGVRQGRGKTSKMPDDFPGGQQAWSMLTREKRNT